jgi:hypothetical protein
MYTNLYVYTPLPIDMTGKLYWRLKKNGKWTWKAYVAPPGTKLVLINSDQEEE